MQLIGPNGIFDLGHTGTHILLVIIIAILYYKWFANAENFEPVEDVTVKTPIATHAAPVMTLPAVPTLPVMPSPVSLPQPVASPPSNSVNSIDALRQLYPPPS